ncbi:hypothetical protein V8E36_005651 [Tilletia maclaganii]
MHAHKAASRLCSASAVRLHCTGGTARPGAAAAVGASTPSRTCDAQIATRRGAVGFATVATGPTPPRSDPQTTSVSDLVAEVAGIYAPLSTSSDIARHWLLRLDRLANAERRVGHRVAVVGSTLSGTASLLPTLLDEPLRDEAGPSPGASSPHGERLAQLQSRTKAAFASASRPLSQHVLRIVHEPTFPASDAPQSGHLLTAASAQQQAAYTLPISIPWIGPEDSAPFEIIEILDPQMDASTLSLLYDVDQILFVSDSYTLARASQAVSSSSGHGDATLDLLLYFADKPGAHLLVNDVNGTMTASSGTAAGLAKGALGDTAFGALQRGALASAQDGAGETAIIGIDIAAAVEANGSLRKAVSTNNVELGHEKAAALWDRFSTLYTRSSLGTARSLLQPPTGSQSDTRRSHALFTLGHAISDVSALTARREGRLAAVSGVIVQLDAEVEGLARKMVEEALEAGRDTSMVPTSSSRPGRVLTSDTEAVPDDGAAIPTESPEAAEPASTGFSRVISSLVKVFRSDPVLTSDRSALPASQATDSRRVLPSLTERRPGAVEAAFRSRLALWKLVLLGRSDEVGIVLEQAVSNSFAKEEEEKLLFQAGRLKHLAEDTVAKTDALLVAALTSLRGRASATTRTALSDILSPTQLNTIRAGLPSHHSHKSILDDPYILARPISNRRAQLLGSASSQSSLPSAKTASRPSGGVIDALAARAQNAVLRTYLLLVPAGVLTGGPFLSRIALGSGLVSTENGKEALATGATTASNAPGLQALEYLASLEPGTALSLSALLTLVSIYTLQSSWTKSKRTFWKEWDALAHNVAADVQANADEVVRSHVGAYPALLKEELRRWVRAEGAAVSQLRERVLRAKHHLGSVASVESRWGVGPRSSDQPAVQPHPNQ